MYESFVFRGTTPVIRIQFCDENQFNEIEKFRIAFSQSSNILFIVDETSDRVIIDEDNKSILIHLTEEQTLSLSSAIPLDIQIRMYSVGEIYSSAIYQMKIRCILEDGDFN